MRLPCGLSFKRRRSIHTKERGRDEGLKKKRREEGDKEKGKKVKMAAAIELPPGFRFHPTDEELVMHYLCRKCASQPIAVPIIAEIDLYKFNPWDLPGNFLPLQYQNN